MQAVCNSPPPFNYRALSYSRTKVGKSKTVQCFFCVTHWHCNNYKVCRYLKRHF